MSAIYKREVKAYFTSVLGYMMIGVFLFLIGLFFWGNNLKGQNASVGATLYSVSSLFIIILPMLSMRLFAEEQRQKTDQLLFSAPVTIMEVILGKFFAVVTVFSVPFLLVCTMPLVISTYASGKYPFLTNYASILIFWLMGCVMLSLGILISSMTDSQVVAGLVSIAVNFLIWLMSSIASIIPATATASVIGISILLLLGCIFLFVFMKNIIVAGAAFVVGEAILVALLQWKSTIFESLFGKILSSVSFYSRAADFVDGTFSVGTIIYFVSFIWLFLYLTMQMIQKRRYS